MSADPQTAAAIAGFSGELSTRRLCLKPVLPDDASELYSQFNDWEVVRWLALPPWPLEPEHIDRYAAACVEGHRSGQVLALTIQPAGQPVGVIAWENSSRFSHLGYWLGREHWGKGYVSEAAAAVCDWIFAATPESMIYSGVFEGNGASLAIQKKLGFVETGRSLHYCTPRQQDLAHIDTKLTRTMRRVARTRDRS